jgi:hypothetical protein
MQAKKKPYCGSDEQVILVAFHFPFAEQPN